MRTYVDESLKMARDLLDSIMLIEPPESDRIRDALEHYDEATRLSALVNKLKIAADKVKTQAKHRAIDRLEAEELDGAPTTINGQKIRFTKYEFRAARIADYDEFAAWAKEQDEEAYFEPEYKVRQELVNALAKQREDDGEPLPPGLTMWRDTKLSRTAESGRDFPPRRLVTEEE